MEGLRRFHFAYIQHCSWDSTELMDMLSATGNSIGNTPLPRPHAYLRERWVHMNRAHVELIVTGKLIPGLM